MEFCSGSDLSIYIKKRGQIESLDYVPKFSSTGEKVFWPHPEAGGLDERVTRHFLGQLGKRFSTLPAELKLIKQRLPFASCVLMT
jgi:serine/threonine-protein kinase ULK/ATG1